MADTKLDARDAVVRAVSALQERTVFIQVVKKKEKKSMMFFLTVAHSVLSGIRYLGENRLSFLILLRIRSP